MSEEQTTQVTEPVETTQTTAPVAPTIQQLILLLQQLGKKLLARNLELTLT